VRLANRLYAEKSFDIDTTYFTIVRHAFDVWIEPVDFTADPDAARAKINTWVAEQTEQRIKDLIGPGMLSAATKLVIVNAVHFLERWAGPFDPAASAPGPFWVNGPTSAPGPRMRQHATYRTVADARATLVELPYEGDTAALYVVLPAGRDGLAAVEAKLGETIKALEPELASESLVLSLPKLTLAPPAPLQLAGVLQALGIRDAFEPDRADFSGMARGKLFISSVIHQAFVELDEQGTEAAAATAVIAKGGGAPQAPRALAIDHPFVFVIVDRATGLFLFMGRVVDPAS